jgi:hypothetical protein
MFCDFASHVSISTASLNPKKRPRLRDAVRNLYQLRCPAAIQNVAADQLLLQLGNGLWNFTLQPRPEARQQLGLVARCEAGAGSDSNCSLTSLEPFG